MNKKNFLIKMIALIIIIIASKGLIAQVPQGINYQAVLRNTSGTIMQNQAVTIKFTIHKTTPNGTTAYEETQSTTTNNYGLVNLQIGQGTPLAGNFSTIHWGINTCFLQVQANIGAGYIDLGTTQFLSVPYAMVADTVLHSPSGGSGWGLTGNSGSIDGTNFIGTLDSVALNFKVYGQKAGRIDPTGSTFFGYKAGMNNLSTNGNTGFGINSLFSNTTAYNNTAIGANALYSTTTGYGNTAIGFGTLYSNTTGYINTAFGRNALNSNTVGRHNIAIGNAALTNNTVAGQNIAIGSSALNQQSFDNSGTAYNSDNIAIGYQALTANQPTTTLEGYQSIAIGSYSLKANTIGFRNTAVGSNTLYGNTTGAANTAIGLAALQGNTTGEDNTGIGMWALDGNLTGSDNSALGYYCFANGTAYSNSTALGANTDITASNQIRLGDASVTSIGGYKAWTNLSDVRIKKDIEETIPGLAFIIKLRPVSYHLNMDAIARFNNKPDSLRHKDAEAIQGSILQTGFIAQEVEKAAEDCGFDFSGVDKPKNENDLYGLRYSEFVVPLVKGMQEQQVMIEELKKQVAALQEQLLKLQGINK